ncbi:MAG: hypothetical protein VX265_00965, partial [Myxococcota bacterium]|nr:hypothetical protein [Myxococcota bacterium]
MRRSWVAPADTRAYPAARSLQRCVRPHRAPEARHRTAPPTLPRKDAGASIQWRVDDFAELADFNLDPASIRRLDRE